MHLPQNGDGPLEDISIRDNKIGRHQRYERIFKIDKIIHFKTNQGVYLISHKLY